MDEMPSAQFRKRYAGLRTQVVVTVNGHAIGMWTPLLSDQEVLEQLRHAARERPAAEMAAELNAERPTKQVVVTARAGQPMFAQYRPVPKPGQRK